MKKACAVLAAAATLLAIVGVGTSASAKSRVAIYGPPSCVELPGVFCGPTEAATLQIVDVANPAAPTRVVKVGFETADFLNPHFMFFDAAGNLFYFLVAVSDAGETLTGGLMKLAPNSSSPQHVPSPIEVPYLDPQRQFLGEPVVAYDATRNAMAIYNPPSCMELPGVICGPTEAATLQIVDLANPARTPRLVQAGFETADFLNPYFMFFDAAGNLFYFVVAVSDAGETLTGGLMKLAPNSNSPRHVYSPIETPYLDPQRRLLGEPLAAYDATRNVMAIYNPPSCVALPGVICGPSEAATLQVVDLANPSTPPTPVQVDFEAGGFLNPYFMFFDAAGNLFFFVQAVSETGTITGAGLMKLAPNSNSPQHIPSPIEALYLDQERRFLGEPLAAYDPGQRIFLDWTTKLPFSAVVKQDTNGNRVTVDKICAVSGPCPSPPSTTKSQRQKLTETVRRLYAQSGAALPVLSADNFPGLVTGSNPANPLKLANAIRVRFGKAYPLDAANTQFLLGQAYEGVDTCNTNRSDNVAIYGGVADFGRVYNASSSATPSALDYMSLTIAHEAGHATGLSHLLDTAGSKMDIMDYEKINPSRERFRPTEVEVWQSPKATIPACAGNAKPPSGQASSCRYRDGSQNAQYHLRAHSLDESIAFLEGVARLRPGTKDASCRASRRRNRLVIKDVNASVDLRDVTVFEADGDIGIDPDEANPVDDSSTVQLAFFDQLDSNAVLEARSRGESSLKVRASSASLDRFDIEFATASVNGYQDGFDSTTGQIDDGVLLRYSADPFAAPEVVGTFRASVEPISQADISVEMSTDVVQATVGEEFSYAVHTRNIGAESALANTLQVVLPAEFKLARFEPADADCTGIATVQCALGQLQADEDSVIRLYGRVDSSTRVTAQAEVMSESVEITLENNMTAAQTTIAGRVIGDVDTDGDIDDDDLQGLLSGVGTFSSPGDRRDLDADGAITALDARKLVLLCTRARCAVE